MAVTIITKNGSGVPLASDLVKGELAVIVLASLHLETLQRVPVWDDRLRRSGFVHNVPELP